MGVQGLMAILQAQVAQAQESQEHLIASEMEPSPAARISSCGIYCHLVSSLCNSLYHHQWIVQSHVLDSLSKMHTDLPTLSGGRSDFLAGLSWFLIIGFVCFTHLYSEGIWKSSSGVWFPRSWWSSGMCGQCIGYCCLLVFGLGGQSIHSNSSFALATAALDADWLNSTTMG